MNESEKFFPFQDLNGIYKRVETTIAGLTKDANIRKGLSQEAKAVDLMKKF